MTSPDSLKGLAERRCFFANCTPLWSSIGTEETHTESGGREARIGRLDPPIVWSDDGGEFAVERYCVCVKSPVKGIVRLLCNGAADGNFYGRVFARLRMAEKYDWRREQADEKLSGELYEMLRADSAAAKAEDAAPELEVMDDGTCRYCGKFVLAGIGHEECGPLDTQREPKL